MSQKEPVDLFVVGLPKQMNNELSENMIHIEAFVKHLKRIIPTIPNCVFGRTLYIRIGSQSHAGRKIKKKKKTR